ncbi:MAG: glucosaminidase domain-containing protein [Niabella sp.]
MIHRKILTSVLLLLTIAGTAQKSDAIEEYIRTYRLLAIEEMHRTGVPAAIKLAQGIHETMAGQSELVQKSNNHFGIKCKSGYDGPYVLHDDDARNERFMKYDSPEQSYRDHSDFLKSRSRYSSLFELDPSDYQGWAYGLKKAGYATNPRYPQLIIGLIEKYNLQDYTLMALGKKQMPDDMREMMAKLNIADTPSTPVAPKYPEGIFTINDTKVIFVKKGTAYNELAEQHHVPLKWLFDFNEILPGTEKAAKDGLVFLQLKRTVGKDLVHEVQEGESIYDIAQTQGMRLESLLKYNNLTKFSSPAIGSKLYLQPTTNTVVVN